MSIPGPLMPGAGGPMPMGPGMPPGVGGPGGPGGGPDQALQVLAQLQQSPPPDGEQEALRDASMKIGMAVSRIQLRSAKAARLLTEAMAKIQSAREALQQEASRPLAPPPDLGLSGGAIAGTPPGGPGWL